MSPVIVPGAPLFKDYSGVQTAVLKSGVFQPSSQAEKSPSSAVFLSKHDVSFRCLQEGNQMPD